MRERRGLVYTIESSLTLLSDCGSFNVYFGSDHSTVSRCCRLVRDNIRRLADTTLTPRAFAAARDQYCGQLQVSADNRENAAMELGRSLLLHGTPNDWSITAAHIRAVTPEQLRMAAESIAGRQLSRLTLT